MKVINRDDPLLIATITQFEHSPKFEAVFDDESLCVLDSREWLPLSETWPNGLPTKNPPIRVHPNGFIQLELDDNNQRRLHVWDDRLPKQKVYTPIHDHRFSFTSTVLKGALTNIAYEVTSSYDGDHQKWKAIRNEKNQETKLEPFDTPLLVRVIVEQELELGESYDFPARVFHETKFDEQTVTLMTKINFFPDFESSVLVPTGIVPDNGYRRDCLSSSALWSIVEDALV